MLEKLQRHLHNNLPFLKGEKLLLAVSGGVDSMVLVHLFKSAGYDIALAHCNFSLRGAESDGDEAFVREYAEANSLRVHTIKFDTALFAEENKVSIQVAARRLRYFWFDELMQQQGYGYLLTAHHQDDSLETFLINFSRGTGLDGLTGIPQQNGKIIRPLLPFSRKEIHLYAKALTISWREDSSNSSTKYLRNRLRHEVVPVLKAVNPAFDASFADTLNHLQQAQSMADDAAILLYKEVVEEKPDAKVIQLERLLRLPNYRAYLYRWLSPLGFTAWEDVYTLADSQAGKIIYAPAYRLVKDRDTLILEPCSANADNHDLFKIEAGAETLTHPVPLKISTVDNFGPVADKNVFYADKDAFKFPLFVRKWQQGDWFCPSGMNGQKKKLSKFFKDEKLSLPEKEKVWLLCSGEDIAWVIGYRADHRFAARTTTNNIVKIELLK